jgi:IclR family transcriptional regulator, KDG regulon repressor
MIVKGVDRITRILRAIGETNEGLTNSDLSKSLDLPKSTLSKLLNSLASFDWLAFDTVTKRFKLGPLLLFLGGRYLEHLELVQIGQQFLKQLKEDTGETAAMEVPNGQEVVMVARVFADDTKIRDERFSGEVQRLTELGQRAPFYATAAGKCVLAYHTDSEIKNYIQSINFVAITQDTITNPEQLLEELKNIRKTGLAYNFKELNSHTIAIASPVFDLYRRVIAALAVVTPDFRFDKKKRQEVQKAVRRASIGFSKLLGYQE